MHIPPSAVVCISLYSNHVSSQWDRCCGSHTTAHRSISTSIFVYSTILALDSFVCRYVDGIFLSAKIVSCWDTVHFLLSRKIKTTYNKKVEVEMALILKHRKLPS